MLTEFDVKSGERNLHAYDTGNGSADHLTVFWHHGTPNIGTPPRPLFDVSEQLGIRWVSYDRPGYGGSSPKPGRSIASAADDVAVVADHLGIERFAVMGHSGGGPHALACAALMADRVVAVVSGAGLAPFDAEGLDWFAGMARSGVQSLTAAAAGRGEKERFEASGFEYDPEFVPADLEALAGEWSWFNEVVGPALHNGPGPLIDDDIAYVNEWGFAVHQVLAPALFIHGVKDRIVPSSHGTWLAGRCPNSELRLFPDDGHISVLRHAEDALSWLRSQAL
jgi:pimeloyl-ACP methyl ester carboxylesterase